ncbi:thiaminase/transcriptional activator TenA [Rhizobium azooxidifex]|uniref:Aminopyrimidine aminohydrolase n=1 Tax=Mycoplana azooxidifex TaxID=1636188 RepID=A0A7W6D6A5_9HYPH|nr:TenA family protein [Mycoplana azooxidifex]MBB3977545.1 thiaminase/transcriptional activator TenA [Mycoplana azooxidifex]
MREILSEQILRQNRLVFDRMIGHRFVAHIRADRLPQPVFERYLVFERAFADTAISICSFATARAETIVQKRWLIGVLDSLTNRKMAYFEKAFAARGIDPDAYDTDIHEVGDFRDGMLAIARDGGYLDTIAAMFAVDWMYWTWSKAASVGTISDPLLKEWVELHTSDAFAAQARWLKKELDRLGETLDAPERQRLSAVFGKAQALEIAFHDAPYLCPEKTAMLPGGGGDIRQLA